MRLINAATLELEEFNASQDRPAYAILSHRWVDGEEVTFNDIKGTHRRWMPGWAKIQFCCRQAIQDGLTHAWVDTCCIDKDSSAELSEAINSMYGWYASAKVCYAYLNDVKADNASPLWARIANSLWFTRAWTLQELLAPGHVVFYNQHFFRLASKHDIAVNTEDLVRIPARVLGDPRNILLYPVAVRMSWAAHRKATRLEDVAYSLFGIFQVNLPLLYGEGDRAFVRLQEEVIKQSHDHSIFSWTAKDVKPARFAGFNVLPLLAPSLDRFEDCSDVSTMEENHEIKAYTMTNIGLEIELQVTPYDLNVYAALINCGPGSVGTRYAILIARESIKSSRFYRITVRGQSLVEVSDLVNFQWQRMHIVRSPDIEYRRKRNVAVGDQSVVPVTIGLPDSCA